MGMALGDKLRITLFGESPGTGGGEAARDPHGSRVPV